MQYDKETAGSIMQLELVAVREGVTVKDVIERVRALASEVGDIHDVYIIYLGLTALFLTLLSLAW